VIVEKNVTQTLATETETIVTISKVKALDSVTITTPTASVAGTSVLSVQLSTAKEISNVTLDVKSVDAPTGVAAPSGVTVHKYLEISASNIKTGDLDRALVTFQVEKSKVKDSNKVKLMRYANNEWTKLTTIYAGESGDFYKFTAETPGFSYFAIIEEAATAPVTQPTTNVTPGGKPTIAKADYNTLAIIAVILVLLVAAYYWLYVRKPSWKKFK
jgi:PGF-pre-PGF domain-containing protein